MIELVVWLEDGIVDDTMTVELNQRGTLTLPERVRERYRLHPGDRLTILDLGGVLLLSPQHSIIDTLADQLRDSLIAQGETFESMLQALHEERHPHAD